MKRNVPPTQSEPAAKKARVDPTRSLPEGCPLTVSDAERLLAAGYVITERDPNVDCKCLVFDPRTPNEEYSFSGRRYCTVCARRPCPRCRVPWPPGMLKYTLVCEYRSDTNVCRLDRACRANSPRERQGKDDDR
jgi:hypothetical protein